MGCSVTELLSHSCSLNMQSYLSQAVQPLLSRPLLLVPKGTPQDVYDVLYKGFTGMIQDPRFAEFAATNSLIIDMKSPEEVTSSVKAELEDMRVVFQDLKLGIYADK